MHDQNKNDNFKAFYVFVTKHFKMMIIYEMYTFKYDFSYKYTLVK